MCQSRLQTIYKPKYLCANCKKCFKDTDSGKAMWGINLPNVAEKRENGKICPDCKQPMLLVSRDFRPPRQTKKKEWAAIKVLADYGYPPLGTHGCGCVWHPEVPKNVQQALDALEVGRIYISRQRSDSGYRESSFILRRQPLVIKPVHKKRRSHMAVTPN